MLNPWARCALGFAMLTAMSTAMSTVAFAQTEAAVPGRRLFTWEDAALGGAFVVATIAIRPLDKRTADVMQQPDRQRNRFLKKAAYDFKTIAAPGAVIIGVSMYAVGRFSNSDHLASLGLHGTEALFLGEATGQVLKDFFGRARPFVDTVPNPDNWQLMRGFGSSDKYHSFPSGHTVAAFAAAGAVTAETSRWWPKSTYAIGPAMYGGAALVGLARMYDNRHWASDVIMGAAIGTFAGIKVVRYSSTHSGNRLDRWLLNASASPGDLGHLRFSLVPLLR
jgi:membrane-associated phospholipid phosphatase